MAIAWYVEKRTNETWRALSDMFIDWIQANGGLAKFGFHEGDELVTGSLTLACFQIPDRHGGSVELFGAWAETTGRVFGKALNGVIDLGGGRIVEL